MRTMRVRSEGQLSKRTPRESRAFALWARALRRLTVVFVALFLGLGWAVVPWQPVLETERQEQTETSERDEIAWASAETRIEGRAQAFDTRTVAKPLPATPRDLFARYRTWPPSGPSTRGPEAPSPPPFHLLN